MPSIQTVRGSVSTDDVFYVTARTRPNGVIPLPTCIVCAGLRFDDQKLIMVTVADLSTEQLAPIVERQLPITNLEGIAAILADESLIVLSFDDYGARTRATDGSLIANLYELDQAGVATLKALRDALVLDPSNPDAPHADRARSFLRSV